MKYGQKLAEEIQAKRNALGLSQSKLAKECGLDPSYISRIENNQLSYSPSEESIASIAEVLELNEYQLQLWAGHIPEQIKPDVINFLLAYPSERAKEILERLFYSAIF